MSSLISIYARTTVYLRTVSTRNDYGEPTYGTAVTTSARVDVKRRMVKNARGEDVLSEASVLLRPTETTGDGMQISLDGTNYQDVITLASPRDINGRVSHYVAYI